MVMVIKIVTVIMTVKVMMKVIANMTVMITDDDGRRWRTDNGNDSDSA